MIVPDDQLSLAIGREGQNARLAARLTGWRVDITSETEFAEEERGRRATRSEEAADGRCAAILATGRRCPNAALPGSRYCGLPQHQALAPLRRPTRSPCSSAARATQPRSGRRPTPTPRRCSRAASRRREAELHRFADGGRR